MLIFVSHKDNDIYMNKIQAYKIQALFAKKTQHAKLSFVITSNKADKIAKKINSLKDECLIDTLQETMMSVFSAINGHYQTVSLTQCDTVDNNLNVSLVFSSTHYNEITSDTMIAHEDFKTDIISAICEYLDIEKTICVFSDITKCNLTETDIIITCDDDFQICLHLD